MKKTIPDRHISAFTYWLMQQGYKATISKKGYKYYRAGAQQNFIQIYCHVGVPQKEYKAMIEAAQAEGV